MFYIDKHTKKAIALEKKSFLELKLHERSDLQEWIVSNPDILGERLLIIQKEFAGFSDTKERLDLLALDESGRLVIIENKLDDSGRDVVWQALKYASYCATLKKDEICDIYQKYLQGDCQAEDKLSEFFDEPDYESISLNPVDVDQRIIFVAANFRKEVTSTVLWLREHGIDITCIKVTPFVDEGKLYLDTEQILPIQEIGEYQIKLSEKRQETIVTAKEEASRHKIRLQFWEMVIPALQKKTGMYSNATSTKENWINGYSGMSGVYINPVILMNGARAEIYIDTGNKEKNKHVFHVLKGMQLNLDAKFESQLDWQELPEKRACRICIHYPSGLIDEKQWGNIIEFYCIYLPKLRDVFRTPLEEALKHNS
jgi:hypothetical protein